MQTGNPAEIRFYKSNEKPFGVFSNLLRRPIVFEGETYPTAEHAYQAGKANKPEIRAWLLAAPTPALCAIAAHGLPSWDVVSDWATAKLVRMRAVLRAKFDQHADLRELLLGTGDARIVEAGTTNNAVNRFWGEVNGKGTNMLGVMLMDLRSELREKAGEACPFCGEGFAGAKVKLLECPECKRDGCPECMPGGVGCVCPECEEKDS